MNNRFTNTNYDIGNQAFTLMIKLLTFTIDFAFLCRPIWGNASVSPLSLVLTSFGGTEFLKKYLTNGVPPRSAFPLDYTTGEGHYF